MMIILPAAKGTSVIFVLG